ncbi:MAG: HAD family hydrolase [Halobacteriota archaeon]
MAIRGVAFDLDETLAVPRRSRETLLAEAVSIADAPAITRSEYLQAHRRNLTETTREPIFADILDRYDESTIDPAELTAAYRRLVTEAIEPLCGVEALIDELRREYRVGLLTNGPIEAQRVKLERLGWTDRFDAALVTGELEAGKPDRAAFEALVSAMGTDPAETVYVGDAPVDDIGGASTAGLCTVQVIFDGGPDPDPRADRHLDRDRLAADLVAVVETLG